MRSGRESTYVPLLPLLMRWGGPARPHAHEVYYTPRTWAEAAYPNLVHYNQLDKGGHFAAWEQPMLLVDEMRAGFESLR